MGIFNHGIGIDVSDHHVRIARVTHAGVPEGLFELSLPHGLIHDDVVDKPDKLRVELVKLLHKAKLDHLDDPTVILIPESRVFATNFILPPTLRGEALNDEAYRLAQKEIPLPLKDTDLNIHRGVKDEDGLHVTVNAVQKSVINGLMKVFGGTNLPIVTMESNNHALYRLYREFADVSVQLQDEHDYVMVMDIGHRWTNITLYDKSHSTVFSRSIALRKLADTSRGKVKNISSKMIKRICEGEYNAVSFFEAKGKNVPIAIVGGVEGVQKGICIECGKMTKTCKAVRIGDVVKFDGLSVEDVQTYGAALGAALRAARPKRFNREQEFSVEDYDQDKK